MFPLIPSSIKINSIRFNSTLMPFTNRIKIGRYYRKPVSLRFLATAVYEGHLLSLESGHLNMIV